MSIETTLTLILAGVILVTGLVLRLLVIGTLRLWTALEGRERFRGYRDRIEEALPSGRLREPVRAVVAGIGALVFYVVAAVARAGRSGVGALLVVVRSAVAGLVAAGNKATAGMIAAGRWIGPLLASGLRRAHGVWIKAVVVVQEIYWAPAGRAPGHRAGAFGVNPGLVGAGPVVAAGLRARTPERSGWDTARGFTA